MRISTVAIVAALAIAVSGPAGLAGGTFEQCESKAFALGMVHGQAGRAEYVRECMGARPGNGNIAARESSSAR
jgi:hypothetical protein